MIDDNCWCDTDDHVDDDIGANECRWVIDCDRLCDTDDDDDDDDHVFIRWW